MAKVTLMEIASSGASMETCMELMAKHIETRLKALEEAHTSKTEEMLASVLSALSTMKTEVKVAAAIVPQPVINVEVPSSAAPVESKKIKMVFERNLSGSIESATIVKE